MVLSPTTQVWVVQACFDGQVQKMSVWNIWEEKCSRSEGLVLLIGSINHFCANIKGHEKSEWEISILTTLSKLLVWLRILPGLCRIPWQSLPASSEITKIEGQCGLSGGGRWADEALNSSTDSAQQFEQTRLHCTLQSDLATLPCWAHARLYILK